MLHVAGGILLAALALALLPLIIVVGRVILVWVFWGGLAVYLFFFIWTQIHPWAAFAAVGLAFICWLKGRMPSLCSGRQEKDAIGSARNDRKYGEIW